MAAEGERRGLSGRRSAGMHRGDDPARPARGLQAATGLPAVALLPTQIVALQAAVQTLSGYPDRLHVWTRCAKEEAARYA